MDNINTIVFAIFAVFGIVGALIGFSKGLIRSAVKVATILLAFVVALAITPTVLGKAYELVLPTIDDILSKFGDVFVASPTLKEFFPTLAQALVQPVVFIVVFAVCLLVAGIVRAIVNLLLKAILPKKKGLIGRLGGLAFGLVGGVLIALCFVFPIAGYFNYVPAIYTNVRDVVSSEENPIDPTLEENIINLPNLPAIKFTNDLTDEYFKQLSSYKDGETDVSSLEVLTTISSIVPPTMRFVSSVGEIETMDDQAIRDIATILENNDQLRVIATEIVNQASIKWINNESFLGYNLQEKFDPDYKIVLDLILADLATCTPDTIVGVLNDIADTVSAVKIIYAPAMHFVNSTSDINTLDTQAVRDIGAVLADYDKLRDMATEIVNYASQKWLNNEPFFGINLQEKVGPELQTVVAMVLEDMATCTSDTIVALINDLADTIGAVKEIAEPAKRLMESANDISQLDMQAVRDISQVLSEHQKLRTMATEIVNTAADSWLNNESFMGINLQEKVGAELQMIVGFVLEDMSTCTPDTIVGVLNDTADIVDTATASLLPAVKRFVDSMENISAIDVQAVRDIGQALSEQQKLRVMATELVNTATSKWLNNEEFMGINLQEKLDAELKNVFDPMLADMATCTEDQLVGLLNELADSIQTVSEIIPTAKQFANSVSSISTLDDQAVRDIGTILEGNDEFRVIATDVINVAATKWLNNEEFMGYNLLEKMDDEYEVVLEAMLRDLSECTPDTVVEVLNKIANTIQTVREIWG